MSYLWKVCFDVLPMDVEHVLLGHPWIYDKNATNFGQNNTHLFSHNGKTRPQDYNKTKGTTTESLHSNKQP